MSNKHEQKQHAAMQDAPWGTFPSLSDKRPTVLYETEYGHMIFGRAEDALMSDFVQRHKGRIQLVFTSPPFPLNHKKKYGNLQGEKYIAWLASFAQPLAELLAPDGSIVIELGNAWVPGKPVMSTLALEALLAFRKAATLYLCQQFICNNPARLPGPAQWVNVERIRVKDSFTHLWWMAPSTSPKADNRRILKPYSAAMLQLLKSRKYSSGKRPSQHNIHPTSCYVNLQEKKKTLPLSSTAHRLLHCSLCTEPGIRIPPMIASFSAEPPVIRGRGHSHASSCLFVRDQETACASHFRTCWQCLLPAQGGQRSRSRHAVHACARRSRSVKSAYAILPFLSLTVLTEVWSRSPCGGAA